MNGAAPDARPLLEQVCALLRHASAAAAYEAMGKQGDLVPAIRSLVPDLLCVGPAYTVKARPGYGDEIARAADAAPPGSVIVIDAGPEGEACTWGGTGAAIAQRRGIAGVVSNGRIRDMAEIRRARFPVFARGAVVSGWRRGPGGATGVPVDLGGHVVHPGDVLCADDDGVVLVPRSCFPAFLPRLRERLAFERQAEQLARSGGTYEHIMDAKSERTA